MSRGDGRKKREAAQSVIKSIRIIRIIKAISRAGRKTGGA
jgi:hypothetical protein